MANHVRIVLGQLNFLVGDIKGNTQKILKNIQHAQHELAADVIVFPELALTGYQPEDLLLRQEFHTQITEALEIIAAHTQSITVILGVPQHGHNSAVVFQDGNLIAHYHKHDLPNFGVFDDKRYFAPGSQPCVITVKNLKIGILICQDIWHPAPMKAAIQAGAQAIICINASPFQNNKHADRLAVLQQRITEHPVPICYVNLVGVQDEIIFDGDSMVLNEQGEIVAHAGYFEEQLLSSALPPPLRGRVGVGGNKESLAYQALVHGVRDYAHKNKFSHALLGLSGGIDSALTLAIAVDALGKENIHAVIMPSRYTSPLSLEMAEQQAKTIGVKYSIISIENIFENFLNSLSEEFKNKKPDITEENLQARCRGTLLMALSNKLGGLVLTTGNKSELAVGYSTLYGDMAGGFAVLKDVWKTFVFELARYRNTISPIIPEEVIKRAPTAELSHNQKDEDSLPPYAILDPILQRYIEQNESIEQIIAAGFDAETVKHVITLVLKNEYKRRQSPPGIKITRCAFGRERRYPITSGYIP